MQYFYIFFFTFKWCNDQNKRMSDRTKKVTDITENTLVIMQPQPTERSFLSYYTPIAEKQVLRKSIVKKLRGKNINKNIILYSYDIPPNRHLIGMYFSVYFRIQKFRDIFHLWYKSSIYIHKSLEVEKSIYWFTIIISWICN